MELGLGGKAVLVTGGSKGIGKATAQVMAAGPLLRRQRPFWTVLLPYFEAAFPATVLPSVLWGAFLLGYFVRKPLEVWHLALFGLLALGLTSTVRGWPWPLRLLIHVGWVLSAGMLTAWYL